MPKKAIDYSNTIIYKIQHQDNEDLLYVGHTTDFTKRKYDHKKCCNNPNSKAYNYKLYKMIRDNGNWECFSMIEIKKFPCNNANEASAEEDRIMREMKANMNSIRPPTGLTKQEYKKQWRIDNADKIKDESKQYRIDNRDKIRESRKIKITCDCGVVVCKNHIARHRRSSKHFLWEQNKNNNIQ